MIILEKNGRWISIGEDQKIKASSPDVLELATGTLEDFEDGVIGDIYRQKAEFLASALGWNLLYGNQVIPERKTKSSIVESLSGRQKALLELWEDYP